MGAYDASGGVNGAPRILADLREAGEVVSRKTVAKLTRDNNIRGISPAAVATRHHHRCHGPAPDPGPGRAQVRPGRVEPGVDL